jgi:hypothetical protein
MVKSCSTLFLLSTMLASSQEVVVLVVDVDNAVTYRSDIGDPNRRGTDTGASTPGAARAFTDLLVVGDIVAVNGRPARGLWTSRQFLMNFSPNPQAGFGVADVTRGALADCKWEFLDANGEFVGAIMDSGYAPHAVVGGVGAFYGIRGQMGAPVTNPNPRPIRAASMSEDPSLRRTLGGGTSRIAFHLVPAVRPEIVTVYDEQFRPITQANPARKGAPLILKASGLGPAKPGTTPAGAEVFPLEPLREVNSPVEVLVGSQAVPVQNKVGWPGSLDAYRIDFQMPAGIDGNSVKLQLTAAWIPGGVVEIPVR